MVSERQHQIAGRTIRYLESGSGWPVALLHAFPVNADIWRPQLERAPAGWRLVAPDLHGATVDEMAEGVLRLLDRLEVERAVIGGISMGGYVAFAAYRLAPERFTGMLLANTRATADTPDAREARRRLIALAREKGSAAVVDEMLPKLLGATSRTGRPDVVSRVREIAEANAPETLIDALGAMMARPDSTPDLERISSATLVIGADEDVATPLPDVEAMQARIPRSRLVVLAGAGHLSNVEVPEAFSKALADFLTANM